MKTKFMYPKMKKSLSEMDAKHVQRFLGARIAKYCHLIWLDDGESQIGTLKLFDCKLEEIKIFRACLDAQRK